MWMQLILKCTEQSGKIQCMYKKELLIIYFVDILSSGFQKKCPKLFGGFTSCHHLPSRFNCSCSEHPGSRENTEFEIWSWAQREYELPGRGGIDGAIDRIGSAAPIDNYAPNEIGIGLQQCLTPPVSLSSSCSQTQMQIFGYIYMSAWCPQSLQNARLW